MSLKRMRSHPRIYDYCYFLANENLRGLKRSFKYLQPAKKLSVLDLGCGDRPLMA